jgi:hypothetical protein
MAHRFAAVVLASLVLAPAAYAGSMNPNPLGLKTTPVREAQNVVEMRVGGGTVGSVFGESSGPVLSAIFEHRLSENLSVGAEVSRSTTKFSTFDDGLNQYGYKYTHNGIAARASYHVRDLFDDPRVDVYGGGTLGYNLFTLSAFGPAVQQPLGKTSYMVTGGFTGGRFWFTPRWGASAEVGYHYALYNSLGFGGLAWGSGSLGLTFRF